MSEINPDKSQHKRPPVSGFDGSSAPTRLNPAIQPPPHPGILGALDDYELLNQIGQGGMGTVFKARDTSSGKIVAVKFLRTELSSHAQAQHRFAREARHMSQLRHSNILEILAVGTRNDVPYFVTPLLERGSLVRILRPDAPLDHEQCLSIASGVASALCYAHGKGITHRDLKPDNVLLDQANTALLTDFGLARTLSNDSITDVTQSHHEGTAAYMSPQLARGEIEDTRCDIYSFGALLYEMLTGQPPYEGASNAEILEKIRHGPPAPIFSLRPGAPTDLVLVAEGAMAREHRDRYASMADVVADLERIANGRAPVGPHTRFSLRGLLPGKTRPLIGLACGCIALGVGALGWMWYRAGFEFRLLWTVAHPQVVEWAGAVTGDWNGDGEVDILKTSGDSLYVVSSRGQQYQPRKLEQPSENAFQLGLMADMNGDGLEEAFVSWSRGATAYISVLNKLAWPLKEYVFAGSLNVHPQWGTNLTTLVPLKLTDLDGDGKRELLAKVTSTWALRPRGLCCFDLETAQRKWFFETATFVMDVEVLDVDLDGRQEILVGSNSPGNGCKLDDGTDDSHVYAYLLSSDGRLRWRQQLGGVFSCALPFQVFSGSSNALVWAKSLPAYDRQLGLTPTGKVLEYGPDGTLVRSNDFGVQLVSALTADLDGDGRVEVLAADRLGVLHVLDRNLKEIQSVQVVSNRFGEVDVQLFEVGTISPPGRRCLFLASSQIERRTDPEPGKSREKFETYLLHDNRVTVLDEHLKQVATHLVAEKWSEPIGIKVKLTPTRTNQPVRVLVLTDKVQSFALSRRPLFARRFFPDDNLRP